MFMVNFYKQFVDDVLVIARWAAILNDITLAMNTFYDDTRATRDVDEHKSVSFLDLDIHISSKILAFEMFRKPLCSYS